MKNEESLWCRMILSNRNILNNPNGLRFFILFCPMVGFGLCNFGGGVVALWRYFVISLFRCFVVALLRYVVIALFCCFNF